MWVYRNASINKILQQKQHLYPINKTAYKKHKEFLEGTRVQTMANHSSFSSSFSYSSLVIRARFLCNCEKNKKKKAVQMWQITKNQLRGNTLPGRTMPEFEAKDRCTCRPIVCPAKSSSPTDLLRSAQSAGCDLCRTIVAAASFSGIVLAANQFLRHPNTRKQNDRNHRKSADQCADRLNPDPSNPPIRKSKCHLRTGTYYPLVRQRDNKLQLTKANEMRSMEATYEPRLGLELKLGCDSDFDSDSRSPFHAIQIDGGPRYKLRHL